jgi:hypothetical protein
MNTKRRIHLNPQSKGNLGKSFEAEFRTAWLESLDVPWTGSDLDDRHHTFAGRHPESVRSYQLGNEHESKSSLLSLFRRVLIDSTPVHIIDTRAQADALIVAALEELQVLEICRESDVRLTFFLFPTDDTESMMNLANLFHFAGDRVNYVIVYNPVKARGDLFKGSRLEAQLFEFGAKAITLPAITPTTLLAMEKAESKAKRGLSFAELSHVELGHLERLLAGEIQWAMQRMFRQYESIAELLLPADFVPKVSAGPVIAALKPEFHANLNFGD